MIIATIERGCIFWREWLSYTPDVHPSLPPLGRGSVRLPSGLPKKVEGGSEREATGLFFFLTQWTAREGKWWSVTMGPG